MEFIGSYEAKTRLPELLRSVERGQSFTITRRGVPIARIVGVEESFKVETGRVVERMKEARGRRRSVPVGELLAARDEGRRN